MNPQTEILSWLVFMLVVAGFLGFLAVVVWRNDQRPLPPARRRPEGDRTRPEPGLPEGENDG